MATGPQCQEVLITLLVSPGSLRLCLGEGGERRVLCVSLMQPSCLSVSLLPSPTQS